MFRLAPLDCYPVVSRSDPAIDDVASDLEAYAETLDRSRLVMMDGEEPALFWLRPLTLRRKSALESAMAAGRTLSDIVETGGLVEVSYEQAYEHALMTLRLTLDRVEGLEVGGEEWQLERSGGMVTAESLEPLSPDMVFELARHAREVSQLPLPDGRTGDI